MIASNIDNVEKSFMYEISIDECNNRQKQEINLKSEYVQQLIETNFPNIVQVDFSLNPGMRSQQIPTQMFHHLNSNQMISTMNNVQGNPYPYQTVPQRAPPIVPTQNSRL
jgi:hypothetical protein